MYVFLVSFFHSLSFCIPGILHHNRARSLDLGSPWVAIRVSEARNGALFHLAHYMVVPTVFKATDIQSLSIRATLSSLVPSWVVQLLVVSILLCLARKVDVDGYVASRLDGVSVP